VLNGPGCDIVHQAGVQAIRRLQPDGFELAANGVHLQRINARFDDRGHKSRKAGLCPTLFLEPLRMDEIQTLKRVRAGRGAITTDQALMAVFLASLSSIVLVGSPLAATHVDVRIDSNSVAKRFWCDYVSVKSR
jgi:hypothetical protein